MDSKGSRGGRKTLNGLFWCPPHKNEDGPKGAWFEPGEFANDPNRVGGKTAECKLCRSNYAKAKRILRAQNRKVNPLPKPPRVPIELPMTLMNMLVTRAWNSNLNLGASK
ncbi:hypothetical protein N9878_01715 [bacterium]|nr:hypothetical protein [bacterium]